MINFLIFTMGAFSIGYGVAEIGNALEWPLSAKLLVSFLAGGTWGHFAGGLLL